MRILLDTNAWLWMVGASDRLGARAKECLADPANELLLSAVSSWEIAMKWALGKLALPSSPEDYVPEAIRESGVKAVPIEHVHALRTTTLPDHHRDPFDRMLIAQAQLEECSIMTADPMFERYDIDVLAAG